MLLDETCFFLAMDFDKSHWLKDTAAVLETCRRLNIPAALERSRSGNGGHVWTFFNEAIPATIARRLGAHILTETMEHRPDIGLDSYDRFFPNQDTLPRGGFGNLIALPLQKRPREFGNSVFLDDGGSPHADQWAFLSSIEQINRRSVEKIVHDASQRGRIINVHIAIPEDDDAEPWLSPPSRDSKPPVITESLPKQITLTLADQIYIAKDGLPPPLCNRLLRTAAFQNPEFYKAQSMRLATWDKPRIIACAEETSKHYRLPRGCLEDVQTMLTNLKIGVDIHDERQPGTPLDVAFQGTLRPGQQTAVDQLLLHDTGILSATTAFGKTVVASWLIAQRQVNTLVLVHRRQLLDQWVERLTEFLDVQENDIGRIGGGRKRPIGRIDVAIIQRLVRNGVVKDCVADYGHVIVDECQHLSARSFELVARRAKAKYVTGLSATVNRKNGHHPIIFMQCGPVRHTVSAKAEAAIRPFARTVLVPRSAVPGWPSDVPLPVNPQWKRDDAASIQRLIRDGVDESLAQLFVHAARSVDSDSTGVARARSASEAFLFRRPETLPETTNRFQLNVQRPIAFDGWDKMEVDFLCEEARVVIELDGGQHFTNEVAYRRDRRKDALLQEHGYFVLRFLVQDIGTRLDAVPDTILRTLSHQRRP